jgi:hypothetical protein
VARADYALYEAKRAGRDRIETAMPAGDLRRERPVDLLTAGEQSESADDHVIRNRSSR